jgi:2-keto-3-deoxy-L-rhamnonate aldolase RhmA
MALGALAGPKWVELAGLYPQVGGVWIDQEHSAIYQHQLEMLLIACRAAGLDAFARVAPTDYTAIMRPYEAGCSGIMAAQIRTLPEVHQVLRWAHYPPLGQRGLFLGNAESRYGKVAAAEHLERASRQRWVAIQIETLEALEQVDAIAAEPGVDWLFVGPADLACALGVPGQVLHPRCREALNHVAQSCRQHGKPWGTLSRTVEHAECCRDLGCQLFSVYGDLDVVHHGFAATRTMFDDVIAGPAG